MGEPPRMTLQTERVLRALLAQPDERRYGLELCAETELHPGTMYPIVARLERVGWVESSWEDPAVHVAAGRPRRRYYRLTQDGAQRARAALERVERSRSKLTADGWRRGVPEVSQ